MTLSRCSSGARARVRFSMLSGRMPMMNATAGRVRTMMKPNQQLVPPTGALDRRDGAICRDSTTSRSSRAATASEVTVVLTMVVSVDIAFRTGSTETG